MKLYSRLILLSIAKSPIFRFKTRFCSNFVVIAWLVLSWHWIASIFSSSFDLFCLVNFPINFLFVCFLFNSTVDIHSALNICLTFHMNGVNLVAVENHNWLRSVAWSIQIGSNCTLHCVCICVSRTRVRFYSDCHWRFMNKNSFFIQQCRWVNLFFWYSENILNHRRI